MPRGPCNSELAIRTQLAHQIPLQTSSSPIKYPSKPAAPPSSTPPNQQLPHQIPLQTSNSPIKYPSKPTAPPSSTPPNQQLSHQIPLQTSSSPIKYSSKPAAPPSSTPPNQQLPHQVPLQTSSSPIKYPSKPAAPPSSTPPNQQLPHQVPLQTSSSPIATSDYSHCLTARHPSCPLLFMIPSVRSRPQSRDAGPWQCLPQRTHPFSGYLWAGTGVLSCTSLSQIQFSGISSDGAAGESEASKATVSLVLLVVSGFQHAKSSRSQTLSPRKPPILGCVPSDTACPKAPKPWGHCSAEEFRAHKSVVWLDPPSLVRSAFSNHNTCPLLLNSG
eukprot:XP_017448570.1 PREDICTED: proline-rich protein 36-like [Rattus norvegicus]